MDWHIVTGSKGGVGKTLLSLMLLTYFWDKNKTSNCLAEQQVPQKYVLAIDLNAMNIDFWRVLKKYNSNYQDLDDISLGKQDSERDFRVLKFFYEGNSYLFMFPSNPYITYEAQSFSDLLVDIKRLSAGQKEYPKLLGSSIETVIIDTNYHFCSLFANVGGDSYNCFRKGGLLETDNIFIWFMWVYAQFSVLYNQADDDAQILLSTATQIEANLSRLVNGNKRSPFLHVTSPASLMIEGTAIESRIKQFWKATKKLSDGSDSSKVLTLNDQNFNKYITFRGWLNAMFKGFKQSEEYEDVHEQFANALTVAIEQCEPVNVLRLMSYEKKLAYYADKDTQFTFDNFTQFELYKELSKSLRGNGL